MGISHQTGSIVQRGKAWYGFYRKEVIDPTTEHVRSVRVCVRLGIKSQMTKLKARDALKAEITKQTGQLADGRILKDGTVTFEWFVRNRYFPLRQGDWRPETAKGGYAPFGRTSADCGRCCSAAQCEQGLGMGPLLQKEAAAPCHSDG